MVAPRYRQAAKLLKLAQQLGPASPGGLDVAVRARRCLRAQELAGSELLALARSMASYRCSDEKSWQQVASVVTQKVEEIEVETMVRIAGSFSRVSQGDPGMLQAMITRIKGSDCTLSCWSWADFILSLQRARIRPDEQLVKAAADAWLTNFETVRKLKFSYIMAFVQASLSVGQFHRGIFFAISELVARRMQNLSPHDLPRVALAFGKAACKDDALMQPLCQAIHKNVPSLSKKQSYWTLCGLRLMDCKDRQLLAELATAWASGGPEEPSDAAFVFSALAKSGALEISLCDRIAAHSLQCVTEFKARHVATILWMCSQSGCTNVEFLEALGKAGCEKVSQFSAKTLCEVSYAGAKLSLAPILGNSIAVTAVERVSEFNGTELAWMIDSISTLSDNPSECLPMLERAALKHVSTYRPIELRHLSVAWAKAQAGHPALMDAVATRAMEVTDSLDPSTVKQLAWVYSELQVTHVNLFKALGQRCSDTVSSFATHQLVFTAFAFGRANVQDETALVSIAAEALKRLGRIDLFLASLLARTFMQADVESAANSALLEGLAVLARQRGWTRFFTKPEAHWTDFQRQCAEAVREFLPSVMVNQRHQMGPVLTLALEQSNGILLNLEVDTADQELSNLELAIRSRRDEFLETLGVEVLRFKVKDLNDLRYDLQQIFGNPAELQERAGLQGPDLGALDKTEAPTPTLHQSWHTEMELEGLQSQVFW